MVGTCGRAQKYIASISILQSQATDKRFFLTDVIADMSNILFVIIWFITIYINKASTIMILKNSLIQ